MTKSAEGKVGSKGELFLPKEIHEQAGFASGDKVVFIATENEVRSIKATSIKDALKRKPFAKIIFEEFENITDEILL